MDCRFSSRTAPTLALLIAAGIGVSGCGGEQPESRSRTAAVVRQDIVVSASAAGVVEPIKTVEVKSKASGEIVEVLIEEGDEVRQGQLLVRVDQRIPMNAVVQAEADSVVARAELDNAEAQLARSEALHASAAITDLEYENAKLARASAYATLVRARRALEDAKIAFEDTEVRAPSDGIILGRNVEVGTVIASASRDVSGGAVLLRMATLDTVQVRALVDETDIGMVAPGLDVTISVAAYPNRPFRGEVLRIGTEALVQQNVTMFPVLIRIGNGERLLRPGMNAEVEIHIGEVRDALTVPNAALRTRAEIETALAPLGLTIEAVRAQLGEAEPVGEAEPGSPQRSAGRPGPDRQGEGRNGTGGRVGSRDASLFGGRYVVFAVRNGAPWAVPVETGLTDYDYTVVLSGLTEDDSVFILPTAGLLQEQQRRGEWIRERVGGPLQTQQGR